MIPVPSLHSFSRFEDMPRANAESDRPRTKFWPRGQLVLEELTSLDCLRGSASATIANY